MGGQLDGRQREAMGGNGTGAENWATGKRRDANATGGYWGQREAMKLEPKNEPQGTNGRQKQQEATGGHDTGAESRDARINGRKKQ